MLPWDWERRYLTAAALMIYPATLPRSENGFETADGVENWNSVFVAGNGGDDDVVVLRPVELDRSVECSRNSWLQIAVFEGIDDTFVVVEERTRDDTSGDVVAVVVDEQEEEVVVVVEQRRKRRKDGQEDTIEIDAAPSRRSSERVPESPFRSNIN